MLFIIRFNIFFLFRSVFNGTLVLETLRPPIHRDSDIYKQK